MKKILNHFFSFFKYIFLIAAFGLTLFITLRMYLRLNKSMVESVYIFLPYGLLLLLFILNFVLRRNAILKNIFFNITCNLVFITNILVCLRAIYDKNLLFNGIQRMGVDFNYFNNYLSFNRIMLYGLIIADIIFMFIPNGDLKNIKKDSSVSKIIPVDSGNVVVKKMDSEII